MGNTYEYKIRVASDNLENVYQFLVVLTEYEEWCDANQTSFSEEPPKDSKKLIEMFDEKNFWGGCVKTSVIDIGKNILMVQADIMVCNEYKTHPDISETVELFDWLSCTVLDGIYQFYYYYKYGELVRTTQKDLYKHKMICQMCRDYYDTYHEGDMGFCSYICERKNKIKTKKSAVKKIEELEKENKQLKEKIALLEAPKID